MNNNEVQANLEYVINYLNQELAIKTEENAVLKSIIQQQNEELQKNKTNDSAEQE
ncbi:hypothetical protein ACOP1M_00345 [Staphylococcus warneri]|uniref:hypothetical protein n=1 Tax=Staphylococcus warneri TaxID=1292 RepID=UPI003CECD7D1